ncbi:hypothetical protein AAKU52_001517 [Pedobacter sp. CG_S7]|uniref:hypothetical protein n=1 Tax=Pedobacter sp. CG_S7 TaxID=3143930 RepID=UPI00339AA115
MKNQDKESETLGTSGIEVFGDGIKSRQVLSIKKEPRAAKEPSTKIMSIFI